MDKQEFHIGKKVQEKVAQLRLTQKEFGEKISRNEKTVADIFARKHMSSDLLLRIVKALNDDLFRHFYEEDETLKRLRQDEISKLNDVIESQNEQIAQLQKEKAQLQNELAQQKELAEARKDHLDSVKEQLQEYKRKTGYDPENKSI